MAEDRIEILMNLYDDTVRLRQKLLGYNFFHEVLSTVPICLRNQDVLEARVREKTGECDKLRKWLKISQDRVSKLNSHYDNLNDYYEVFVENNYAHEFLDFAVYLKNRRESDDKNNAAVNSVTNHWFQRFENLLKKHFVKEANGDNIKQKEELETLRSDSKQKSHQCDSLKSRLDEANQNMSTLSSNLKIAQESLNAEKSLRKRLENERDNFDRLSEELCRLLFKYQQRFSPVDDTRKTKDLPPSNPTIDENSPIEIKSESEIEFDDEFPISLPFDSLDDRLSEENLNWSEFCSKGKKPAASNNQNSAAWCESPSPELIHSLDSFCEPSTSIFSLSLITSESDFDSDSSDDDSEIEIGRYHSFEESRDVESSLDDSNWTDVNNRTIEKPKITAKDLIANTSLPVESNEKPASSKTSNDAIRDPDFSDSRISKVTTGQLFRCDKCGKYFKTNKSGRVLIKCPICNITGTMRRSEKTVPGEQTPKKYDKKFQEVQCDICKKYYQHKWSLKRHKEVVHSGERPYKCDTCGKSFSNKRSLKVHHYVHAKEKNFKCSICGKAFKDPTVRYNHERKIHGEPRFECAHCGIRYTTKQRLIYHIQMHHLPQTSRQFKCKICRKRFAAKSNLKNHYLVHANRRPYECSICGVTFKYKNYLRYHEWKSHGKGERFPCVKCSKVYSIEKNLTSHMKKRHTK